MAMLGGYRCADRCSLIRLLLASFCAARSAPRVLRCSIEEVIAASSRLLRLRVA